MRRKKRTGPLAKEAGPKTRKVKMQLYLNEIQAATQLSGQALALRVKYSSSAARTALAAQLARGQVAIVDLTTAQIASLAGLSVASVKLVKGASDEELKALRCGSMSLYGLRAKRRRARVQMAKPAIAAE